MDFIKTFSKNLSELFGINAELILLITYTILTILIIGLIARGIIFLNTEFNKDAKKLYIFNKKISIAKVIIEFLIILFIWQEQISNIITLISFMGAAATLALRDMISNFIAGIYITIRKPIRLDDRIETTGLTNIIGDVVNFNTLNFEVLEVSKKEEGEQSTGIIVQIPNSKIFTESIKNYTKAFKYVWSELEVKIKLDADLEKNKKLLYEIIKGNDIVKTIPKKMKEELNEVVGDYRIYYNNLEPIIYTKLTDEYVELTIRYLAHPKKERIIESSIWTEIYERAKNNELDLYTKVEVTSEDKKEVKKRVNTKKSVGKTKEISK